MKFRELFEENETPTKLLPAVVHQKMTGLGLTKVSSISRDGHDEHIWEGPRIDSKKINGSVRKELSGHGYYSAGSHVYGSHARYYFSHKKKYDIDPPLHQIEVINEKGKTTVRQTLPTPEREAVSQKEYMHGNAWVVGSNKEGMHHRFAQGPNKQSVEAAYDHYLAAHGTDRETEKERRNFPSSEAKEIPSRGPDPNPGFIKNWSHFRTRT